MHVANVCVFSTSTTILVESGRYEMAGAGWSMDETPTAVSVRSQANVQSKLNSVSQNLLCLRIWQDSH